jgi:hypothetical protein
MKVLHELGAAGLVGSYATCLTLVLLTPSLPLPAYLSSRQAIVEVTRWLMMPSLAVTLISGLLAMAVTPAYNDMVWVWIKAALGLSVFEGTFISIGNAAKRVSELAVLAGSEASSALQLDRAVSAERNTLWLLMVVSVVNVILAVWRPRFRHR